MVYTFVHCIFSSFFPFAKPYIMTRQLSAGSFYINIFTVLVSLVHSATYREAGQFSAYFHTSSQLFSFCNMCLKLNELKLCIMILSDGQLKTLQESKCIDCFLIICAPQINFFCIFWRQDFLYCLTGCCSLSNSLNNMIQGTEYSKNMSNSIYLWQK